MGLKFIKKSTISSSDLSIDDKGNVYIVSDSGAIYRLDSNGRLKEKLLEGKS